MASSKLSKRSPVLPSELVEEILYRIPHGSLDTNKDADFKLNWKRVAITSMFGLGFVATAYNTDANVSTLQITHSASMETDPAPPISSPADNSTAISASPSDIVCVPETTQFNTDSGFIGNITTSTSVSPTSSAPLVFAAAGTLSLSTLVVDLKCKSSVDGLRDSCLQLSNAKGSNRFANLAMLEEDIQLDVVTSPSQSMSPSVETSAQFVYNSSLPSTPSSFSDLFVDNVVATSSDNFDMAQRSRGY
ncbi:hypothetical protein F2Q70_00032698, partial [Brassica cretica]